MAMDDGEDGDGYDEDSIEDESVFIGREVAQCFSVFDQKDTGLMPSKFLNKALESLGILLTTTEFEDVFKKLDKEGFVEMSDFATYASEKITETDPAKLLKTAFTSFDSEKEGMFPTDRFKKWMTTLGDPLTESEAKELCKLGDPTNKGVFLYDDVIPRLLY